MIKSITPEWLMQVQQLFFPNVKNYDVCYSVYDTLIKDEVRYKEICEVNLLYPNNGLCSLAFYRLSNFILKNNLYNDNNLQQINDLLKCKNYCKKNYTNYISPFSTIGEGFVITGNHNEINDNVLIGNNCVIDSNNVFGVLNTYNYDKNILHIDSNCTFNNNTIIYSNIKIGNNVYVDNNCIIRENISDNSKVSIVNQLMLTESKSSRLPSQTLIIYGVVPKYKNTLIIMGEGFYNPKVIIRLKQKKEINFEISYWDKNKIMIKFKNNKYSKELVDGSVIVIMSNGIKVSIINNFALQKTLLSLVE